MNMGDNYQGPISRTVKGLVGLPEKVCRGLGKRGTLGGLAGLLLTGFNPIAGVLGAFIGYESPRIYGETKKTNK